MRVLIAVLMLCDFALGASFHDMRPKKALAHGDLADISLFETSVRLRPKAVSPNEATTTSLVLKSGPKVEVLIFTSPSCGPCVAMYPEYDKLRAIKWNVSMEAGAHFRQVVCEENQDLVIKYGVMSIPCVLKLVNGREVSRQGFTTALGLAELYYGKKSE